MDDAGDAAYFSTFGQPTHDLQLSSYDHDLLHHPQAFQDPPIFTNQLHASSADSSHPHSLPVSLQYPQLSLPIDQPYALPHEQALAMTAANDLMINPMLQPPLPIASPTRVVTRQQKRLADASTGDPTFFNDASFVARDAQGDMGRIELAEVCFCLSFFKSQI
ncbi:hypothetical protein SISSUDRAFT_1041227 [Sistotremastrum suecicum HHB10207 ss-3]|uniref:Uncharacterized protein n=1 Tax=Sistotremastrum suecicum HHB10207 ss-3 TaxID=1314776 RepID=A0A166HE89_9AGAM|nr:hypothetical protein SISSUDRAFT_1041227 [Sistotremastrum suecicum HHB10207 ss-3]